MIYDCLIIGAGPAGITASLYIARANLSVMVLYQGKSALEKTKLIQNYYGFSDGISGKQLYETGIKQAQNIGVQVKTEEATKIQNSQNGFKVITPEAEYEAKTIILATGNSKNKPKIIGIEEFEGKGVSYCAVCDGFFYRNKEVCVIGSGNYAISEVNELLALAKKITVLTNGEKKPEFRADNVNIETKEIQKITGKDKVEGIQFKNGTNLKTDGIFIAQGVAGSLDFAKKLGIMTSQNKIIVNDNMETNIKGIYACGDCTRADCFKFQKQFMKELLQECKQFNL